MKPKMIVRNFLLVSLLFSSSICLGDDGSTDWCEKLLIDTWYVVDAGDIGYHIKRKVKIDRPGNSGKFRVRIYKERDSWFSKYRGENFTLSCDVDSAELHGSVNIDDCEHEFRLYIPFVDRNGPDYGRIGFKSKTEHPDGKCPDHPERAQLGILHLGTAHGGTN